MTLNEVISKLEMIRAISGGEIEFGVLMADHDEKGVPTGDFMVDCEVSVNLIGQPCPTHGDHRLAVISFDDDPQPVMKDPPTMLKVVPKGEGPDA